MPNPLIDAMFRSPMAQNFVARYPNSFMARVFGQRTQPPPLTRGSNNAGIQPETNPPPATPGYGGRQTAANAFFGGGSNNATRNMAAPIPTTYGAPGGSFGGGGAGNSFGGLDQYSVVSFAAGGMMTEQGTAVRPGQPMPPPMSQPDGGPQMGADAPPSLDISRIDQEAQRFVQQNPQQVQQMQAVVAHAIQIGELTPSELNMAVQLAKAALANPASYPQVRQFAIENGLGTEQEIPQQLDKGMLFTLITIGKGMAPGQGSAAAPQAGAMQGPAPTSGLPEYKDGGMTGDKPHVAKLHPREYVIPEDVVLYHGKKNLDKLVEQARTPPNEQ